MKKILVISLFIFACISLNAQIFRPLDQMSDFDRSTHLAERFWYGFAFDDTMYLHREEFIGRRDVFGSVDIYSGAIARYLQLIQFADLPVIQRSLAETLRKADVNERMYRQFVESFSFFLHDPISRLRNEQWIEPIWHQMLQSQWATFADSARIQHFLRLADINRVGSVSADLEFVTVQGQRGRMHDIETELLLLYFYIPGCPQCRMIMEWINSDSTFQAILQAGILTAFAFYPEGNVDLFQSYAENIPSTWINARDPDGMSQLMEDNLYQMRGAPTIYLLDRNNRVVLKDARMDLLFREFARAKERFLGE